jgi:hypothetical protein
MTSLKPTNRKDSEMTKRSRIHRQMARAAARRMHARHRLIVHGLVIVAIGVSLMIDGGGPADWLFVGLSVLCEVA